MNDIPGNYPSGLNAMLYSLYYIANINDEKEYIKLEKELSKNYSKEKLEMFNKAIDWSLSNKDVDFTKRLPDLHYDNVQIVIFLEKTKEILEKLINKK